MFSWSSAPFLVALATFITYTLSGHTLTAQKAFVSLALFNLLRFPLAMLPMMISAIVEATVSVHRVRKFLLHDEKDPNNVIRDPSALRESPFIDRFDNALPALYVDHGTFAWKPGEPVLHDVTFQVMPSSCTAVVGRVGSGKSSLVSALHGDMVRMSGRVVMPGSVAYVPQQAWVRNATLRDNILFGKPYEEAKYNRVLFACALLDDLQQLPGGDQTEIGEKGINLSGGQKQRVSLARAVYQDADVYIMDDCLSAVDSHVGKHIFQHVIGPEGCLANRARFLVTHALHVLPECDSIIMMREGRILEQGTYADLLEHGGEFNRLIDEFSAAEEKEKEEEEERERLSRQASSAPHPPATSATSTSTATATGASGAVNANVVPRSVVVEEPTQQQQQQQQRQRKDDDDAAASVVSDAANEDGDTAALLNKNAGHGALSVQTDETSAVPVIVQHGGGGGGGGSSGAVRARRTRIRSSTADDEDVDIDGASEKQPLLSASAESINGSKKALIVGKADPGDEKAALRNKNKTGAAGGSGGSRLIADESAMEGGVEWNVYKSYFEAVSYTIVFGLAFLYLATYGFQVGSSFWLSYWSSQDEHHQDNANYTEPLTTGGFLGVYAGLGLLNSAGTYFVALVMAIGSLHASRVFHTRMLDTVS